MMGARKSACVIRTRFVKKGIGIGGEEGLGTEKAC